jgi:error-prone DNA polymerase
MGKEPVTFDHPSLEPALGETLGVVLYQEQVLQVSMALAGFTAGQAESLRRAMSRKRSKEAIAKLKEQFMDGCQVKGVSRQAAESAFRKIEGFAEFGFPKAHAAAFGLLAYQTAWLRAYYPSEFVCSLFNAQPMGFYAPHVLVNDGKRHGVAVLPPDINRSGANCGIEEEIGNWKLEIGEAPARYAPTSSRGSVGGQDGPESHVDSGLAVRIGMRYVRGLSETTAGEIEEERGRAGEFRSVFDFLERTRLKREAVENLIACGAFDSFGLERRELLWQLGLVYRSQGRQAEQRQLALALPTEQDMITPRPMTDWDKMRTDYLVLGLTTGRHPMSFLRTRFHEGVATSRMLEEMEDGAKLEVGGLVVCRQRPGTAKGFVFMVLEDEFGLVNVVVKPDVYEEQRRIIRGEPFILVRGELQRRDGLVNLVAESFASMQVGDGLAPASHNFGHGGHGGRH